MVLNALIALICYNDLISSISYDGVKNCNDDNGLYNNVMHDDCIRQS